MKKDIIKSLIRDFQERSVPEFVPRQISIPVFSGKIITLIGARRCGKTYLLYQLTEQLIAMGVVKEQIFFLNFEDERLDLEARDLDLLLQSYRELYPELDLAECHFLFDEIQNISGWERFVRRVHERVSKNVYITGSSARLLSSEIATALRGRALPRTVYPFSFREVLQARGIGMDLHSPRQRSLIESTLDNYLEEGGFPETLSMTSQALRRETLQTYFEVMLLKDLADRYQFTNITALRFFLKRLAVSATKPVSVHRIFQELKSAGIRIGKNALYDFLRGAEDIFLVRTLPKYAPRISTRELGGKKIYVIDNGLLNALRFGFTDDRGKALEQAVFWHLIRHQDSSTELFYYTNKYECDFLLWKASRKVAMQVCYSLENFKTKQREVNGLLQTCKALGLDSGTIITRAESAALTVDNIRIIVKPLASFLLAPEDH